MAASLQFVRERLGMELDVTPLTLWLTPTTDGGDRLRAGSGALGQLGAQQPVGAGPGQPAQPSGQALPVPVTVGHCGQQGGQGLGLDVEGLARTGWTSGLAARRSPGRSTP
ncbi:MAG: hypothetical protein ACYCXN_10540, partial [Acidimicrobiales bacterium]